MLRTASRVDANQPAIVERLRAIGASVLHVNNQQFACNVEVFLVYLVHNKSTTMERFESKIDKNPGHGPKGDCWLWTAAKKPNGYGAFGVGGRRENGGRMEYAHRFAYELANGPIPDGMQVLHSCDNPACVNPAHLSVGTQLDNMQDMTSKGRHSNQQATHCPQGHPYDEANTIIGKKGRYCRACRNKNTLDHYYRVRRAKELKPPKPPLTHCKRGHEYTPDNTYVQPSTGLKHCNTCRRERVAQRKAT